jgi:hypothetical protein
MKLAPVKKLLAKGFISPTLKLAIEESLKAIKNKDLELAYQLSACKSYIANKIDPKRRAFRSNAFQEDREKNEATLKASAYCIMDNFNADIAWTLQAMPSGMMTVYKTESGLVVESMKIIGQHPIIKRMKYEKKLLNQRFRRK